MKTFLIGDIHGALTRLVALLRNAKLIDDADAWIGADAKLIFLGDLIDRGPDGIGVIELIMRLQSQAAPVGGDVRCLLGNHEAQFLAAYRFGKAEPHFLAAWRRNGGLDSDMARATPRHMSWLRNLPAMMRLGSRLLVHADSAIYLSHGPTIEGVNASIRAVLNNPEPDDWEDLIDDFSQHRAFASQRRGEATMRDFLRHYGGEQIVHGHTPIQVMGDVITPTEPFYYLEKRVVNIDGGMAMGAPGFIWQIS